MDSNISGLTLLNRYTLHERLGRGGMGEVYRGTDVNLERPVAIKVLHGHLADEEGFRARFEREAKTMAALNHRLIASVFDYGYDEAHDVYLIVLEYLPKGLLEDQMRMLATQPLGARLNAVRRYFLPLLDAVAYAHERGMIHRDIKPSNILFNEAGEPVLADFGLARLVSSDRLTATGMTVGTPAYMAPEQGLGQSGDARSDLYSLGVILYEMLSGETPFHSETPFGVIMQHVNEPLPPIRKRVPDLSADLGAVVERALAKQPDNRFQTGAEFREYLQAALKGEHIFTPSTLHLDTISAPTPAPETNLLSAVSSTLSIPIQAVRRRPMLLWGALGGLALIFVVVMLVDRFRPAVVTATPTVDAIAEDAGGLPAMTVPDNSAGGSVESMAAPANLSDTFDDPASGWPVLGTGAITYVYDGGRYLFTNTAPAEGATAVFNPAFTFTNTYLEVQAELVDGQPASAYGLIFRYQDESNFYVFTVSGLGQVSLWALEDGRWRELRGGDDPWTDSEAVAVDGPNLLSIVADGEHLDMLVNGEHVIVLDDDTYDGGAVGFYVATTTGAVEEPLAQVSFDDFVARHSIPAMTEP